MSEPCIKTFLDDILSGTEPIFEVYNPSKNVETVFEHIDAGQCKNWIDHYPNLANQLLNELYSREQREDDMTENYAILRHYMIGLIAELLDFEATEAFTRHNGS